MIAWILLIYKLKPEGSYIDGSLKVIRKKKRHSEYAIVEDGELNT